MNPASHSFTVIVFALVSLPLRVEAENVRFPARQAVATQDLLTAVATNKVEDVRHHIKNKSRDLNVKDIEGNTPLMVAAKMQHEEIVRLLINNGADLFAKNNQGEEALLIAAHTGNEKLVDAFIQAITSRHRYKKHDLVIQEAYKELHKRKPRTLTKSDVLTTVASLVIFTSIGLILWHIKKKQIAKHEHIV